ncbi:hypothetical protein FRC03_009784, partial [Tulasnella sp. 419]
MSIEHSAKLTSEAVTLGYSVKQSSTILVLPQAGLNMLSGLATHSYFWITLESIYLAQFDILSPNKLSEIVCISIQTTFPSPHLRISLDHT